MPPDSTFEAAAAALKPTLGTLIALRVARFGPPGAFLAADPTDTSPRAPTVLLPGAEVPEGCAVGDEIEVFITLDSEDRPLATTVVPRLARGEVAFLRVTALTGFGAFVDWGLPKELLVPHKEQTRDVRVGERHPICLYVDDTGRLAGTMRVTEWLASGGDFTVGEWVDGECWRKDPDIGVFVIVERRFVGLVPKTEPTSLTRGQAAQFRVAHVHADGKFELSTRGRAHEEIADDARAVLARLGQAPRPRVGDRSSPAEIHALFGLSKKAFKRAVGRLLKDGQVVLDDEGWVVPAHGA